MKEDIYTLIAQGEHQQQDFKFEISDARKIARTLSAFSNTEGGRLLIGVKDNGRISGIRSEEEAYMIQAAAGMYCRPAVEVEFTNYITEGRTVLVATVKPTPHAPVSALDEKGKPWAYLRVADQNILATPVHLSVWRMRKAPQGILLHYSAREQKLLAHFIREEGLTLNRCCRLTGYRRKEVERLLAQLICMEVLECVYQDPHFIYRLKD